MDPSNDEKTELIQELKQNIKENGLTPNIVAQIINIIPQFASTDDLGIIKQARADRRDFYVMRDMAQYTEVYEYWTDAQAKKRKGIQKKVVELLGVPETTWEQTLSTYQKEESTEVADAFLHEDENYAKRLASQKELSLEEFKTAFKKRIELYTSIVQQEKPEMETHVAEAYDFAPNVFKQFILLCIQHLTWDKLALELQVEEEDLYQALKKYNHLPECQALVDEFKEVQSRVKVNV